MSTGIKYAIGILVTFSSLCGVATLSQATPANSSQDFPQVTPIAQTYVSQLDSPQTENIPDTINRAFFHHSPSGISEGYVWMQIRNIFGLTAFPAGSYPENQIRRTNRLINTLYHDLLEQQVQSDPTVRTNDLPSPYCSSIMTNPEAICF